MMMELDALNVIEKQKKLMLLKKDELIKMASLKLKTDSINHGLTKKQLIEIIIQQHHQQQQQNNNNSSMIRNGFVLIISLILISFISNSAYGDEKLCFTNGKNDGAIERFLNDVTNDYFDHAVGLQLISDLNPEILENKIKASLNSDCKYEILKVNHNLFNELMLKKTIDDFLLKYLNDDILKVIMIKDNNNDLMILKDYLESNQILIRNEKLISAKNIGFIFLTTDITKQTLEKYQYDLDELDIKHLKWHRNFVGRVTVKKIE